jgi:hypothetical protein
LEPKGEANATSHTALLEEGLSLQRLWRLTRPGGENGQQEGMLFHSAGRLFF